ncbi:hypothetical protein scyTo_0001173 [Scyliorhinus torazame]|uniref:Uncharacterized protein n=1 Tax=Scyliorhinus torazame TaxID=75743 RepID=A0A401PA53_SCYTO|nr:hypothetical protein [Scyliorhinus torazame]
MTSDDFGTAVVEVEETVVDGVEPAAAVCGVDETDVVGSDMTSSDSDAAVLEVEESVVNAVEPAADVEDVSVVADLDSEV